MTLDWSVRARVLNTTKNYRLASKRKAHSVCVCVSAQELAFQVITVRKTDCGL